jgi:hypothetical protein
MTRPIIAGFAPFRIDAGFTMAAAQIVHLLVMIEVLVSLRAGAQTKLDR